MVDARSVLLLDDGELDRVQSILEQLDADFVRLRSHEIPSSLTAPRDLLVTSGRRALNSMPRLETPGYAAAEPIWVCLHGQDFLPLRERLRALGVHYLVQGALDQESLRLFLIQLLFRGADRRSCLRLPLGSEVFCGLGSDTYKAKLIDLSPETCRIRSLVDFGPETPVHLMLPAELSGGHELELQGRSIRSAACDGPEGERAHLVVIRFEGLELDVRERLESLVSGEQIGTRLTPLAQLPDAGSEPGPAEPPATGEPDRERRGEPRHEYRRRVLAFGAAGTAEPQVALGRELSVEGVCIEGTSGLEPGSRLTLALHGCARDEPVVVEARVVRDDGERGIALHFEDVTPFQRRGLERLTVGPPTLESLAPDARDDSRVIVSQVVQRNDG
jgi:hypothetical protein